MPNKHSIKKRSVDEFRSNFDNDLDFIRNNSSNQLIIKSPKGKGNIVLLSEVEFKSMEETLYLLTNKKNREYLLESIQQGKDQKVTKIELIDLWK
jgi:antitoxin YefM